MRKHDSDYSRKQPFNAHVHVFLHHPIYRWLLLTALTAPTAPASVHCCIFKDGGPRAAPELAARAPHTPEKGAIAGSADDARTPP